MTRLANDFASVCVNQYYNLLCAEKLKGSDVKVCTVVGFRKCPHRCEGIRDEGCHRDGAQEIDMVINVGALKDKKYDYVKMIFIP